METIIEFETAKIAKSKGFFKGLLLYNQEGKVWQTYFIGDEERKQFSAASQAALSKWLREEHNIDIWVRPDRVIRGEKANGYTASVVGKDNEYYHWDLGGIHNKYECAFEVALLKALEMIR
jgi:hypothetical protein